MWEKKMFGAILKKNKKKETIQRIDRANNPFWIKNFAWAISTQKKDEKNELCYEIEMCANYYQSAAKAVDLNGTLFKQFKFFFRFV